MLCQVDGINNDVRQVGFSRVTAIIVNIRSLSWEHFSFADLITKAWSLCCGGNVSSDGRELASPASPPQVRPELFKRAKGKGAEKHLLV